MINGHVGLGIGVVVSTDVFGELVESVLFEVLISLEHHVFKEVSESASAVRIIFPSYVIPDLNRDRWGGMIFHRINLETVRQTGML